MVACQRIMTSPGLVTCHEITGRLHILRRMGASVSEGWEPHFRCSFSEVASPFSEGWEAHFPKDGNLLFRWMRNPFPDGWEPLFQRMGTSFSDGGWPLNGGIGTPFTKDENPFFPMEGGPPSPMGGHPFAEGWGPYFSEG